MPPDNMIQVMVRRRSHNPNLLMAVLAATLACSSPAPGQSPDGPPPLIPESTTLDEAASQAMDAPYLTDGERRRLRVFHGVWDESDLVEPAARAMVALNAWDFDDPALSDPAVPAEIRAEARLLLGELEQAINLAEGSDSIRARRIHCEALAELGRYGEALAATEGPFVWLNDAHREDPGEITEAVRVLALRSRLQAAPADEFHHMMRLLARVHQNLDRLYWPALLAEARLLLEKRDEEDAVKALHETLRLNPRCAEAWHLLGRIALERFDFDSVHAATDRLLSLNPEHPLATLLTAEARIIQDDPADAIAQLEPLLRLRPTFRTALALKAAAFASLYDWPSMRAALEHYDALSPGSAAACFIVGRHLSMQYQYDEASELLTEAMRRLPAWSAPRIELGLLSMRQGLDDQALLYLRAASELDPINKRAANTVLLLEELPTFRKVETEHFVLRYRPGVDQVVADMMVDELEPMHRLVSSRYEHEPAQKTLIELMPDRRRFAVRLTGMPRVGTIAACTGPVIALEVPREGMKRDHHGIFDWPRVLRHEYAHTITLDQTRFRIPRWLTEGVSECMEQAPRTYGRCRMLASSHKNKTLSDPDEIDWAFRRPKKRGDSGKAYAQSHWMIEFIDEEYGESAVIALMQRYLAGESTEGAMRSTFGMSGQTFFHRFLTWAGEQVEVWGLAAKPSLTELTDELRRSDPDLAMVMATSRQARLDAIVKRLTEQIGQPATRPDQRLKARDWPELVRPPVEITDQQLQRWRTLYPDHPDLLEMELRRKIGENGDINSELIPLLERYAALRPVDPFPHKKLAQYYLNSDDPPRAVEHLEYLDARADDTVVYALELARLYRSAGETDRALAKITRALQINPYHAAHRELAAAIAIEAGRHDLARRHIFALTLLEPDRPRHRRRLQRIDAIIAAGKASFD
ncbi:MAG: tetratricopeptide repeat protein [Phycisphaerales bacterium]|nr:MAG: tetratricopeptide repeat protein [Phycisphaerales bacterium]